MGGTRAIGLMGSTMGTVSRLGLEGADTGGSIDKGYGTGLGCIGFIRGMFMQANGPMDRVMGVVFILVRMVAVMLGSSSGLLNTDLDIIILGNFLNFDMSY